MPSLTDYFERTAYKAQFEVGTRVFGFWNTIPIVGTVYGDTVISTEQGPRLSIHLDLPLFFEDKVYYIIIDKRKSFKNLTILTDFDSNRSDQILKNNKLRKK
jgi:hypothetical protein